MDKTKSKFRWNDKSAAAFAKGFTGNQAAAKDKLYNAYSKLKEMFADEPKPDEPKPVKTKSR